MSTIPHRFLERGPGAHGGSAPFAARALRAQGRQRAARLRAGDEAEKSHGENPRPLGAAGTTS